MDAVVWYAMERVTQDESCCFTFPSTTRCVLFCVGENPLWNQTQTEGQVYYTKASASWLDSGADSGAVK